MKGIAEFSNLPAYWNIILKTMTGDVLMSTVDDLMYVVLREAENMCLVGK
jgi:hypothetical protein